jgi:uncharacterized protein (TIGR02266 family)
VRVSSYWVGDSAGRVLGPLSLQALRDLMGAGRMRNVVRASRDGNTWVPLQELDEIKDLLGALKPTPAMEQQQVERLRTQLKGLQALKTPQDVFGVKPHASLDEVRTAFFRMAKRFSPEHLAAETSADLKKVSADIFDFLSQRMREAEGMFARGAVPSRTPPPVLGPTPAGGTPQLQPAARTPPALSPVSAAPPPASAVPAARTPPPAAPATPAYRSVAPRTSAPSYSSEEFVGLVKREADKIHADIRVTPKNIGMFMDHPLINLATGGVFIPCDRPLRLGTQVELTLRFEQPPRAIALRSSVIWENAVDDGRQPRGYGLRLSELRAEDRAFLQDFVRGNRRP